MSKTSNPKYLVGTTYKTRGRSPRLCTVVDIHVTRNLAGDVVKTRYVSTHEFMGQTLTDYDVVETTISMGLVMAFVEPQEDCA